MKASIGINRTYVKEKKGLLGVLLSVLSFPLLLIGGLFRFIGLYMRKALCLLGIASIFLITASFSPAEGGRAAVPELEDMAVYMNTGEGVKAIETMDEDELLRISGEEDGFASMQDLESAISRNQGSKEDVLEKSGTEAGYGHISSESKDRNYQTDSEARIYDEKKGEYVTAAYEDDWSLMLINKEHPIPEDYEFELTYIKGAIRSDARVAPYALNILKGAKEDGLTIYICSPYRNPEKQQALFNKKMRSYMKEGATETEAYAMAGHVVAIPGTSEHEAGLAFDFISKDHQTLDEAFGNTPEGQWLREHCAEYGFILRYPNGKEEITDIEYEPWHFRFVGVEAAKEITERGITLEEYDREIGLAE